MNLESIKSRTSQHFSINGIEIKIKDPLPASINFKKTVFRAFSKVPGHLLSNLKAIKVGQFSQLNDMGFQGLYQNNTIYLSNNHVDEDSIIDDLIHEVAHSVEVKFKKIIYSDGELKKEFLKKRSKLWHLMRDKGLEVDLEMFSNPEFCPKLDYFFYKKVGYPILGVYTSNLFYSPYAATSLREYFANGFEAFFMKEKIERLKKLSPILYNKIIQLMQLK